MFDEIKMKFMLARARREQRRMSADVQEMDREVEETPLAPSDPDGYEVFKKSAQARACLSLSRLYG
jgi:hypothetical protein